MPGDLHSALKTDEVGRAGASSGVEFVLMRLRQGRDKSAHSLHARPNTFSTAGFQTTDLLGVLGFSRSQCAFVVGGECYVRAVDESFDVDGFASSP